MGKDLADVVPAAAYYGEDGVAERPFQRAPRQTPVAFHVSDLGIDGAAPSKPRLQLRRQAPACSADQHFRARSLVAPISAIHDGQRVHLAGEDFHLFQRLGQGMAVVGIARQGPHADDEAFVDGGGEADLGAELRALAGLDFGNQQHDDGALQPRDEGQPEFGLFQDGDVREN